MTRKIVLILLSGLFLTATSPGCGTTFECSNNLDASTLGFTLVVPAAYVCQASIPPSSPALALLVYQDSTTNRSVLVLVSEPPDSGGQVDGVLDESVTSTDLGNYTSTPNAIVFERAMVTSTDDDSVLYVAVTTLPSGNLLAIFIDAPADAADLATLLTTIVDTVALTSA